MLYLPPLLGCSVSPLERTNTAAHTSGAQPASAPPPLPRLPLLSPVATAIAQHSHAHLYAPAQRIPDAVQRRVGRCHLGRDQPFQASTLHTSTHGGG